MIEVFEMQVLDRLEWSEENNRIFEENKTIYCGFWHNLCWNVDDLKAMTPCC